jgi:hypothetical protein
LDNGVNICNYNHYDYVKVDNMPVQSGIGDQQAMAEPGLGRSGVKNANIAQGGAGTDLGLFFDSNLINRAKRHT